MLLRLRTRIAGSLRIKTSLLVGLILIPLLGIYFWYDVQQHGQELDNLLKQKAESMAITSAKAVSHLLEDAIATGRLTREQVFDTNYQLIPNTDPPKYHTAYDSFTDANFQEIWNGLAYRLFRKGIRTGDYPKECIGCRNLQDPE